MDFATIQGMLELVLGAVGLTKLSKELLEQLRTRLAEVTGGLPAQVKVLMAIVLGTALGAVTGTDVVSLLPGDYAIDDGMMAGALAAGVFALIKLIGKKQEPVTEEVRAA